MLFLMDVPKVPSGAEVPLELAVEHDGVEELCGEALEGVAHAAAATPHDVLKALLEHVCMCKSYQLTLML